MISGIIRRASRESRRLTTVLISRNPACVERTHLSVSTAGRCYSATGLKSEATKHLKSESLVKSTPLARIESKIALGFTCKPCGHRVNRLISRVAYQNGLVLVRCPGCKNVHLIADNIGWFKDLVPGVRNIEEILATKGETVRKYLDEEEVFEVGDTSTDISQKKS